MKEIILKRGQIALIDDEDFDLVAAFRWRAVRPRGVLYARARSREKVVHMHRLITGVPQGLFVDHINHNGLDNRRENLRICTLSQNSANQLVASRVTGYRGVGFHSGERRVCHYRARVRSLGKSLYGPYRLTASEAAVDYDLIALRLFGEFAILNFPKLRAAA